VSYACQDHTDGRARRKAPISSQDFVREVYDASYRRLVVQMLALGRPG